MQWQDRDGGRSSGSPGGGHPGATRDRHHGSGQSWLNSIVFPSRAFGPSMNRILWLALAFSGAVVAPAAHADDALPPLSIYGAARLDIIADDSRMSDIAQPMYVTLEGTHGHYDGEL